MADLSADCVLIAPNGCRVSDHPVINRLDHRASGGEGGAQIVRKRGNDLTAVCLRLITALECLLDAGRHGVEPECQPVDLRRAARIGFLNAPTIIASGDAARACLDMRNGLTDLSSD